MCTLAAASLAATGLGTAFTAYGQIQQGKAQQAQYNYQAAVDRNNAVIAERLAKDAEDRGKKEEQQQRQGVRQLIGQQRSAFAGNGIDLGSMNVTDTTADTALLGELDALTIRNNAEREAYGFRVQGMNYTASAGMNTLAGRNARSAGKMGAISTVLGGAGSLGSTAVDFRSKGVKLYP